MADQVQQIYSFLKSKWLHYSEKWVIEAIEYYRSRDPNISLETLKMEIYDQWKLNNLRDFKIPSFPPNLISHDKITLPGRYAVQVEQMLDASQSCYSQLQKLHKVSLDNIEATKNPTEWHVNIKPTRCLTLTLSDGVQEIRAMEYAPIKKLRTDDPELLPGFKMIIIGPVQCRKGMILLKDENLQVIGGEVEAFSKIYKQESILCKKLNIEESNDEENDENPQQVESGNNDNALDASVLLSENDEVFMNVSLDTDFDDMIVPQNHIQVNSQLGNQNEIMQLNTQANNQNQIIQAVNQPYLSKPTENSNKEKTKQTTLSSFLSQNIKKPEEIKKEMKKEFPIIIHHKPFVYLKQILDSDFKKPAVFCVKAVILTMKKKIMIQNNNFIMSAIITDGSCATEVEFSPETLENIMQYSTLEIKELSRQKAHNSAVADRLKQIFLNAQQKLISLCCLMEINFANDEDLPCVISLKNLKEEHLNELRSRKLEESLKNYVFLS